MRKPKGRVVPPQAPDILDLKVRTLMAMREVHDAATMRVWLIQHVGWAKLRVDALDDAQLEAFAADILQQVQKHDLVPQHDRQGILDRSPESTDHSDQGSV